MEKYIEQFFILTNSLNDSKNDSLKLKLLQSLLVIHRNYSEMRKYAQHNYFTSNSQIGNLLNENEDFQHGSFPLARSQTVKSSRVFSFFSRKKICKSYIDKDDEMSMINLPLKKP